MERHFIFDKYNTWADWDLIVTAKDITPPEPKTYYVELDGMSGSLDLSESLSNEICYEDRELKASFWTDAGNFKQRIQLLKKITSAIHGRKVKIIEPDDSTHYLFGRPVIKKQNNILPYLEFEIEAKCEPWRYRIEETNREIELTKTSVPIIITNDGDKTVCPLITVYDDANLVMNNATVSLSAGQYKISDIKLFSGANEIRVSGSGKLIFTYREADL